MSTLSDILRNATVPGDAVILPPGAFVANLPIFVEALDSGEVGFDSNTPPVTHIDGNFFDYLLQVGFRVSWQSYNGPPAFFGFNNQAFTSDTVQTILGEIVDQEWSNVWLDISGGTSAAPILDIAETPHQDATYILDFNGCVGANGNAQFYGLGDPTITFDNSQPFSASIGPTIGTADSPSAAQMAAYCAANIVDGNWVYGQTAELGEPGTVIYTDNNESDYPLNFSGSGAGLQCQIQSYGQAYSPAQSSLVNAIVNNGGSVNHN